jgi:hypothetical protein
MERGQHRLEVDTHEYLAVVYKRDVSLRVAWGLQLDDRLEFEGWTFSDSSDRLAVDAFWQGALVARWTVLLVDGARSYLPEVRSAYAKTGESARDYQRFGWIATASDIAIAWLLDLIVRPGREFDNYLEQARIVEVPDE